MKVSGFSFIRNAIKFDYPIIEAITSILPICDEFIIAVGNSDDATLPLIQSINSDKIKIIETTWDDSLKEGGKVLAAETNKAFSAISADSDWAFYIQGDEAVHEKDLETIQTAMHQWKDNPEVDGLLFKYIHFYGSYHYVGDSRQWYRNEIRVIKNNKAIFSYRDAQGFRKKPNQKLRVKPIDAHIYHYGWVREPLKQLNKQKNFHNLWHGNKEEEWKPFYKDEVSDEGYTYMSVDSLAHFQGSHSKVMRKRIEAMNWKFEYDVRKKNYSTKVAFLMFIEKITGWRIGEYKNYKII